MEEQIESVETQVETPVVPEAQEPVEQVEEPVEQEEEKKGAASRIRELNQQVKSLNDRISELTKQEDTVPYVSDIKPGEEITPERYQTDVTKTADSIVNLRMKQYEAENRIKSESSDSVKAYPQLDPSSKEFDPELSETITEAVEAHIRVNPYNAQVKKFVDRLMKPYQKAIEKEVGQVTEKLAKQVTQTALRPTQVKKSEKGAGEKSLAELEAELGVVYS